MGLFQTAANVAADQWRDYFYCDSLDGETLAVKGVKKRGYVMGTDNLIANGSIVAVNDGQCMIIVDQGKIVELCAVPGEFVYDTSTEPSIYYGPLGAPLEEVLQKFSWRFAFGGVAPKDQRVYYINTKEITGNKYGTANPVPFRVVDHNIGLDVDITLRCYGEYSFKITSPILFYANVIGNIKHEFTREELQSQMRAELMTALQPAFAHISEMGIRYSAVPGHTTELVQVLNQELSAKWKDLRGIEIVSVAINSIKASEEDEKMIKELQRNAVFRNSDMAAAHLVGSQAQAMQDAAKNTAAGATVAFAGVQAAAASGGASAEQLYKMAQQEKNAVTGWQCAKCGKRDNQGKFCSDCGVAMPPNEGWHCSCGGINKGSFCSQCGKSKPAQTPLYCCDKCGYEPADPANPPKFCPQCADPFTSADKQSSAK